MRPMVLVILAVLVVLPACASGSRDRERPRGPARPNVITYDVKREGFSGGDMGWVELASSAEYVSTDVPARPERVWTAVIDTYRRLGVELAMVDPESGAIGNRQLVFRREVGGERASVYMDCGVTGSGFPRANSGRITASILTYVEPVTEERARLHTKLEATVQSDEGNSTAPVACRSTHELEERIATLAKLRVATQ